MKNQFLSGIRAELPLLLGVIPFGMIYGVLALDAGIPRGQAQAMSLVVFAGSAQMILTQLVKAGTPAIVMVLTVAIVNLRHALYSASVAPHLAHLRPAWKWLLAYLLTDEAYAVSILHYENSSPPPEPGQPDNRHGFLLGAGLALWSTWQISTAVGIFLGSVIPHSWSLDFTLALTFIALVVPALKDRADLAAAASAGLVAVIAFAWPYKLGLVTAALVGILVGVLVEGKS